MTLRERVLDEVAGDLQYHPARGCLYLALAFAALSAGIYLAGPGPTVVRLECFLGGIALLLKGYLLLRTSSEGLALTQREEEELSANHRPLPPIPLLTAQIVQDFGAGAMLLSPFLHSLRSVNESWELPLFSVFGAGAILFGLGWLMRHCVGSTTAGRS